MEGFNTMDWLDSIDDDIDGPRGNHARLSAPAKVLQTLQSPPCHTSLAYEDHTAAEERKTSVVRTKFKSSRTKLGKHVYMGGLGADNHQVGYCANPWCRARMLFSHFRGVKQYKDYGKSTGCPDAVRSGTGRLPTRTKAIRLR